MENKASLSGYIPTLDGWRSVAIVGVMMAHGADSFFRLTGLHSDRLKNIADYGTVGVDVFFAISGFLICSRLIEEHNRNGRISLKGFYIRRCFRILPPYLLYLAGLALLAAGGLVTVGRWEWLGCLFFFRNYVPQQLGGWYTGHFWSLAVEEHFYLIWPGLLLLWGVRRARRYVIPLALALAVWRVVEFRLELGEKLIPGLGFFTRTDIRFDALLWGCAAALLFPVLRDRFGPWFQARTWWVLAGVVVVCVVAKPPLELLWQSALIPLLLVGTILRPSNLAGRILEMAPLRWIGRLSYSLYLWQQLFLVDAATSRGLGFLQNWPWNFAAALGCATLSYYLVERYMIRIGHRLAKPVNAGRQALAVATAGD
jgi:peptidoglycan/LPS O-acetylase OafA/YrhL